VSIFKETLVRLKIQLAMRRTFKDYLCNEKRKSLGKKLSGGLSGKISLKKKFFGEGETESESVSSSERQRGAKCGTRSTLEKKTHAQFRGKKEFCV